MFYATYGSFMHKLIEKYYRKEITRDQMKVEFLMNFSKEVKGDRPSEKIVGDYINNGLSDKVSKGEQVVLPEDLVREADLVDYAKKKNRNIQR